MGAGSEESGLRGSRAYVKDEFLLIDSESDQFISLMRKDPIYRTQIRNAVQSVVGRTYKLGPYKKKAVAVGDPLQDIINKLKTLEVPGSDN